MIAEDVAAEAENVPVVAAEPVAVVENAPAVAKAMVETVASDLAGQAPVAVVETVAADLVAVTVSVIAAAESDLAGQAPVAVTISVIAAVAAVEPVTAAAGIAKKPMETVPAVVGKPVAIPVENAAAVADIKAKAPGAISPTNPGSPTKATSPPGPSGT